MINIQNSFILLENINDFVMHYQLTILSNDPNAQYLLGKFYLENHRFDIKKVFYYISLLSN